MTVQLNILPLSLTNTCASKWSKVHVLTIQTWQQHRYGKHDVNEEILYRLSIFGIKLSKNNASHTSIVRGHALC